MQLEEVRVKNYKGLSDVTVPLSPFSCIIGENNAGKSSLLQSLLLLIDGKKIPHPGCYFDPDQPVEISLTIGSIVPADLEKLAPEHKERFEGILKDGRITLVRTYDATGASGELKYTTSAPKDARYRAEYVAALLKGKKGAGLSKAIQECFQAELQAHPDIAAAAGGITTQAQAKEIVEKLTRLVPEADCELATVPLPSGIENSIRPILPEPIYIPAVKDVNDEVKTKQGTSFSKLLSVLLQIVEPELGDLADVFENFNRKMNRRTVEGAVVDERLDKVKMIEALLREHVVEQFPVASVELRIPPPQLETLFTAANIDVDDGVPGELATKGDGLKRAVLFALLRTYADLQRSEHMPPQKRVSRKMLLLFEEPELYLHPSRQKILVDALRLVAATGHTVLVSTHSPLFLDAQGGGSFIKMAKKPAGKGGKAAASAMHVDLDDVTVREQYQIISFETNNMAFFGSTVVLIEGISDYIVFPRMARLLDQSWCLDKRGVFLCRVNGKGSIAAYRHFFAHFGVRVVVLADLDCLVDGFEHLGASAACATARSELLQMLDRQSTSPDPACTSLSGKQIGDCARSASCREKYLALRSAYHEALAGSGTMEALEAAGNAFFGKEDEVRRLARLKTDASVRQKKVELLEALRNEDILLLQRGSIEDYYPEGLGGVDKPSKALRFCETLQCRDDVVRSCGTVPSNGSECAEFIVTFERIFARANGAQRQVQEGAEGRPFERFAEPEIQAS